ncbi:hypothetical protein NX059_005689 [Plenodomus lindquistii]|nr:hypothetical protein NX059_005689 [Plenodomus lindquistii]
MAQAQILGPHRDSDQPQDFPHQFPLLYSGRQHTPHSFDFSQQQLHHFAVTQMTAQPTQAALVGDAPAGGHSELTSTKQCRHRSGDFQQLQERAFQQQPRPSPKTTLPMNNGANEGYMTGMDQYWGGAPGFDQSSAWNNAQLMGSISSNSFHQNGNLMYNPAALPCGNTQHHSSYGGQLNWTASALRGGIAGTGASGSNFDSIDSPSPRSYLSERAEASISTDSLPSQASSHGDWSSPSSSLPIKISSPQFPQSFSRSSLKPAQNNGFRRRVDAFGSGGDERSTEILPSTSEAGHSAHAPNTAFDDGHQYSPDGSLTSADSSNSSWYGQRYIMPSQAGASVVQQSATAYGAQSEGNASAYSASSSPFSSYISTSGSSSQSVHRSHSEYQARFQVPPTDDLRQRNDDLLIKGKLEGLTYRDIRKKMLGDKPAESTLRGRYRALTKPRKDRVRKPVWHRRDVSNSDHFLCDGNTENSSDRAP